MNNHPKSLFSTCVATTTIALALAAGCDGAPNQPTLDSAQSDQPLYVAQWTQYWTDNQKVIPVCWQAAGFDEWKAFAKEAIVETWEAVLDVKFTGWEDCTVTTDKYVTVYLLDGADGGQSYIGMDTLGITTDPARVWLGLSSTDPARRRYVAVHEFGHVLGFEDAYGPCEPRPNLTSLTEFDERSIMACPNGGNLTDLDVNGAAQIYGYSPTLIALAAGVV